MISRLPVLSFYANTRGGPYIISWIHRLGGLLLTGFILAHIYTLLSLSSPASYAEAVKAYNSFPSTLLEWALAIPLIFHALNGGRIILYECYGLRNDRSMIKWVLSASLIYVTILAFFMLLGNQSVSTMFYWIVVLPFAVAAIYSLNGRLSPLSHAFTWKLQRMTGAFLLVMAPAHMLFMHLNPWVARDPNLVIARTQNGFIKGIDLAILIAVLYHAAYGVITVTRDYVSSRVISTTLTLLVCFFMGVLAFAGARLMLSLGF